MSSGRAANPPVEGVIGETEGDSAEELNWLRAVCDASPVGIYRTDAAGRCINVNPRWCELTGLRPEQAMGAGWLKAIHPEDRARVSREWDAAHRMGHAFESEYRYQRPDGSVVWIYGQVTALHDAAGRVAGYVGSATNVSELRSVREELQQSRMTLESKVTERTQKLFHMALAVEASGDAIVISNVDRQILSWNKAAETMFEWTAAEMIGGNTARLIPDELREEAESLKRRVRCGERVEAFETVRKVKGGGHIEVCLNLFPLRDGRSKIVGTCAVIKNTTEIRKAERRLQRLSRRLLEVQDDERRRLARELHDSAAQTVVALSMNLARLAQPGGYLAPEQRDAILANVLDLAASATRELRTTVYVLHPPLLEEQGLGPALEWFVGGFQARSGISVAVEIEPGLERLPDRYALALFRVAQESLSNVHRHSGSATAVLRLRQEAGCYALEIADAGRGLAPDAEVERGVGISGMRERMAELGGTFDVTFTPHGTTVIARVPIT